MLGVQRLNGFSQLHRHKPVTRIHCLWECLEKEKFMLVSSHPGSSKAAAKSLKNTCDCHRSPAAVARSGLCCKKLFRKFKQQKHGFFHKTAVLILTAIGQCMAQNCGADNRCNWAVHGTRERECLGVYLRLIEAKVLRAGDGGLGGWGQVFPRLAPSLYL